MVFFLWERVIGWGGFILHDFLCLYTVGILIYLYTLHIYKTEKKTKNKKKHDWKIVQRWKCLYLTYFVMLKHGTVNVVKVTTIQL